ncbi:MAG: ATP-binding protein [Anaerolineae bacterium]|nr:ATP-binding protein [Anaerolineae bacterium]
MVTLTDVLEINWIILFFVYGQVFFVTGLVTGLQWRRHSDLDLARALPWLAAFGIAHGLHEWGYIFIPLQAIYLQETVVQIMVIAHLLLLALSFFFLFQFGIELTLPLWPRRPWLRMVPAVALLLWGAAVTARGLATGDSLTELFAIGDGWSRYLLALPGAALAGTGLLHQARLVEALGLEGISVWLKRAAAAFGVYALFGGLIVPTAATFPANVLNYDLLNSTIRIPAQVFRSLCGLGIALFVVRSLDVFRVEAERRMAGMERAQVVAADRERIGRELHDGIIQKIYAAGLRLEDARHLVTEDSTLARQRIGEVMEALNRTIEDIRCYIFDLRAAQQTHELETVLEELVSDLRLDTLLEVDLEVIGQACCRLESQEVGQITQVAREALSNVVQHAEASHVTVGLAYKGHTTVLTVADDGKGLDLDELNNGHTQGQGVANMRARARMLGGELRIGSAPGQGMNLALIVPCQHARPVEHVHEEATEGAA